MSTRALISYIPTLDIEVQFDPNLLPARIHDWIRQRSERRKVDDAQEGKDILYLLPQ